MKATLILGGISLLLGGAVVFYNLRDSGTVQDNDPNVLAPMERETAPIWVEQTPEGTVHTEAAIPMASSVEPLSGPLEEEDDHAIPPSPTVEATIPTPVSRKEINRRIQRRMEYDFYGLIAEVQSKRLTEEVDTLWGEYATEVVEQALQQAFPEEDRSSFSVDCRETICWIDYSSYELPDDAVIRFDRALKPEGNPMFLRGPIHFPLERALWVFGPDFEIEPLVVPQ